MVRVGWYVSSPLRCMVHSWELINRSHNSEGLSSQSLPWTQHTKMSLEYTCELLKQVNFSLISGILDFSLWRFSLQKKLFYYLKFIYSNNKQHFFPWILLYLFCVSVFFLFIKCLPMNMSCLANVCHIPGYRTKIYQTISPNFKLYIMTYNSLFFSNKSLVRS